MSFVLKKINEDEENYTPPRVFSVKIKIGAASDSDLAIPAPSVLPFHCEIYPWGKEHRLVGAPSAFLEINNKEIETWPAVLKDGDVLTIGEFKYKFHILHETMKRSWKASFSSQLAIFLMALLILFELIVIIWLPYTLKHQKGKSLAALKQDIYMTIDNLRGNTRGLNVPDKDTDGASIKGVLISCENEIAIYLRKYGDYMGWDEARTINRDLHILRNITDSWDSLRSSYTKKLQITPKTFIINLINKLEQDAAKQQIQSNKTIQEK